MNTARVGAIQSAEWPYDASVVPLECFSTFFFAVHGVVATVLRSECHGGGGGVGGGTLRVGEQLAVRPQ